MLCCTESQLYSTSIRHERIPCKVWVANEDNSYYMMRHHDCEILPSSLPSEEGSNAVDVESTLAHIEKLKRKPEMKEEREGKKRKRKEGSMRQLYAVINTQYHHSKNAKAPIV